jgi:putative redox protein
METKEQVRWASARSDANDAYQTQITLDNHSFIVDEPLDNGGKDLGPSPGDLLRTSLASCTAITLRMYVNRKGYDVPQIEVKVYSEQVNGKTIFHRQVHLSGNLDTAQRNRMLQIANACPVHKVLTNPIEVLTQLS